ncbi:MAG TPA: fatty acid desaturase [Planctomycetota bacterium]|nr:fatty acid desaturase [Planctomycetota bacterium]
MIDESPASTKPDARAQAAKWKDIVACYQEPNRWRAAWQIVNTHGSYVALWVGMYLTWDRWWWISVLLALLAGGLLARVFIIFHDCGHGSYFRSKRANAVLGFISGLLVFTPYFHWRGQHALHHRSAGDLDRRGVGDVWTMTVEEYLQASRWKRFSYRLARNPVVLFVVAPLFLFLVLQRFPSANVDERERRSVWWMDLAILVMVVAMSWIFGLIPYLILQITAMAVAGTAGVWLFYVQHQFEDVYWERGENWDYTAAALQGSSFYKLPRVLQWFSGNIGFHHIHHLSPRIPNYNLEACHRSDPLFRDVKPLTLMSGLKSLTLRLWNESTNKLVGYREMRRIRKQRRSGNPPSGQLS